MAGRSNFRINWKGKQVSDRVKQACADGINETTAACVRQAKSNHPGWNNVTGTAEGSIQLHRTAYAASLVGEWGSRGVDYMTWLEFLHGHALQAAADLEYPNLGDRIRSRIR